MTKLSKIAARARRLSIVRTNKLLMIKSLAIRRRIWFRVLSRLERGLIDLTLKVTNRVRSRVLAKALYSIVRRLLEALESMVDQMMWKIGAPLVKKLSLIAQKWGNKAAGNWSLDMSFIRFLTIMHLNNMAPLSMRGIQKAN